MRRISVWKRERVAGRVRVLEKSLEPGAADESDGERHPAGGIVVVTIAVVATFAPDTVAAVSTVTIAVAITLVVAVPAVSC